MFETRSHYAALAGLEFTMQARLTFNSVLLPSARVESIHHHAWPILLLLLLLNFIIHIIDCSHTLSLPSTTPRLSPAAFLRNFVLSR